MVRYLCSVGKWLILCHGSVSVTVRVRVGIRVSRIRV